MPEQPVPILQPDGDTEVRLFDHRGGTEAPWYSGWDLTPERRQFFRETALRSHQAKLRALAGDGLEPLHEINVPALNPNALIPQQQQTGLASLSLFSGGGGLDLAFDRAGFRHVASFDTLEAAGVTLRANRPEWDVRAGEDGDVRGVDWSAYRGLVDVLHGGPPCQPFSAAGRQKGSEDKRNMLPEFVRAVQAMRPAAFVAENVPALAGPKFAAYLDEAFRRPLSRDYIVSMFKLSAHEFGVPQVRRRVFLVGLRDDAGCRQMKPPPPTHRADHLTSAMTASLDDDELAPTHGARGALGLPDIGCDALAPTLRSTLTGPRHTTSVLSSASAQKVWRRLHIWPNGVAATREAARKFVPENGHFRLSVADCAVLQGFPAEWEFSGPVYMALGQIGNSVAPPMGYQVARAVARALGAC